MRTVLTITMAVGARLGRHLENSSIVGGGVSGRGAGFLTNMGHAPSWPAAQPATVQRCESRGTQRLLDARTGASPAFRRTEHCVFIQNSKDFPTPIPLPP